MEIKFVGRFVFKNFLYECQRDTDHLLSFGIAARATAHIADRQKSYVTNMSLTPPVAIQMKTDPSKSLKQI